MLVGGVRWGPHEMEMGRRGSCWLVGGGGGGGMRGREVGTQERGVRGTAPWGVMEGQGTGVSI